MRNEYDILSKFIDENMEITVGTLGNYSYYIPITIKINTPEIHIRRENNSSNILIEYEPIVKLDGNAIVLNANFKLIKCETLLLHYPISTTDFENIIINLTQSKYITKISFIGNNSTNDNLLSNIKKIIKESKIKIIEFNNCYFSNIFEHIKHIKSVKVIRMKNCPQFQERDLLLTNGYKFEVF